jgi:hypothetical protein
MSNPLAKFTTRSWLEAAIIVFFAGGGKIVTGQSPRPRGGRVYSIVL